jgi:Fe-S cluster assembly protein SufB
MTTISHPELEGLDRYRFGWAGASARRGLSEAVVRDISAKKNEPGTRLARAGKREFPEALGCL